MWNYQSTDPGLRLTQEVAIRYTGYSSRSDGPCVDHGGVAELSGASSLSRAARSAGDQQHFIALLSTLSRDTTVFSGFTTNQKIRWNQELAVVLDGVLRHDYNRS